MIEYATFCIIFGGSFSETTKEMVFYFLSEINKQTYQDQEMTLQPWIFKLLKQDPSHYKNMD